MAGIAYFVQKIVFPSYPSKTLVNECFLKMKVIFAFTTNKDSSIHDFLMDLVGKKSHIFGQFHSKTATVRRFQMALKCNALLTRQEA